MKRMMKTMAALAVAAGVAVLACSASAEETNWITAEDITDMPETSIRYWFYETPERIALGEAQVEEFQEMFPNIKIEGSIAPDNTDNEMLMAYISTQTHSNIHQSVNIEDQWYVDHDLLFPLNEFPDFEEFMARFDPDLNYTHSDGNVYSISWYSSPYVMYYNKAVLEEIGWDPEKLPQTYSEYYEFAEKATDASKNRYAMSPWVFEEWWRWQFVVYPMYIAAQGDGNIFTEDGAAASFDNEALVESMTFFKTLFDNGWAVGDTADIDPFVSGVAASAIQSSELTSTIRNNAADGFDYVVGPMPLPDGYEAGKFNTYAFVRNLCLFEELGAKDEDEYQRKMRASWEFMKYLLSDEQSAADFAATGDLPCVDGYTEIEAYAQPIADFGPQFDDFNNMLSEAVIGDTDNSMVCEVMQPLQDAYLEVVLNGADVAEAIAEATEEANEIIEEGRE